MFLLGAGASRDGGLPTSVEATHRLLDIVRTLQVSWIPSAVSLGAIELLDRVVEVLGAGVDFEVLISSVRVLDNRDAELLGPFVAEWDSRVATIDEEHSGALGNILAIGLRRMLLISREDLSSFDYLRPLVELGRRDSGVTIATLNYDLSIEDQAHRWQVSIDRGFREFDAGERQVWSASGIRLLKLHGSVDWSRPSQWIKAGHVARFPFVESVDPAADEDAPVLIVGPGNKLRPDPLFTNLYSNLLEQFEQHQRVVVIGYSFRDEHINEAIENWLLRDQRRQLVVVGPGLPDLGAPAMTWADGGVEIQGLTRVLRPVINSHPHQVPPLLVDGRRVAFVHTTARDGIAEAAPLP